MGLSFLLAKWIAKCITGVAPAIPAYWGGSGGGTAANAPAISATCSAAVQLAIPCRHTSVLRVE